MDKYAHRKKTERIRFINQDGNAIVDSDIEINQTNHEFMFGCGAFDAIPAAEPDTEEVRKKFAEFNIDRKIFDERMEKWFAVFNYGTLPFYWGGFEPVEGQSDTERLLRAAKYMQDNSVKVKGHPLCWHTACADWLKPYDNAKVLEKQLNRINREVSAFKGVIDIWDVINEVVIMPVYNRDDNAITRLCKETGRIKLVKEVFDAAKAANPDAVLLINDFNLSESYRILIDGCLNAGVPISAIGIQTHQHQGYMGREKLEDILERFSFFGLPLHFTENTLVSGKIMPPEIEDLNDYKVDEWPTTPEGEERQKNEWREMYEMLFAHPLVQAVTGWDFGDGAWLGAPSGFIRKDGSVKPSYNEIKHMIHEEWHTETMVHTDSDGYAVVSGFKGTYDAMFNSKKASFNLSDKENKEEKTIIFK